MSHESSTSQPENPQPARGDILAPIDGVLYAPKRFTLSSMLRKIKAWLSALPYIRSLCALCGLMIWSAACALLGWAHWASEDFPDTADLWSDQRPASIKIVDRHGRLIAVRGAYASRPVSLNMLPPHMPDAVLAIEDRRFYKHPGFDPIGLARAAYANHRAGRVVQGGSTLTQQLAKNVYLSPDQTLKRKSQEVLLALWLEAKFSKQQILEMYLGRVYFGSGAYGLDAASERYFAKPAADLTLGESAMLAGLLKAPSRLSPHSNPERTSARTTTVLTAMMTHGYIDPLAKDAAFAAPIMVEPADTQSSVNYFADWIWSDVLSLVGKPKSDLTVRTTLDLTAQQAGERAIAAHLDPKKGASEAALIAMDGTGGVRVMIGGADYSASQFNRAALARRQPGSAFKPFVYLAALEGGAAPWSSRIDGPVMIGDWEPTNFSNDYIGQITVARAFAKSLNTVAVILSEEVGREAVAATAARFGLGEMRPLRSIALGAQEVSPLALTQSYLPFANFGYAEQAYGIVEINDERGRAFYRRPAPQAERILSPTHLRQMNMMMHLVTTEGTGRAANLPGREVAGKTGTTNDYRDAWFVGYVPDFVSGVWVGNDENLSMRRVTGGNIPARIWHDFMAEATANMPITPLPKTAVPLRTTDDETLGLLLTKIEQNLP